jgi:hypothetical protein
VILSNLTRGLRYKNKEEENGAYIPGFLYLIAVLGNHQEVDESLSLNLVS